MNYLYIIYYTLATNRLFHLEHYVTALIQYSLLCRLLIVNTINLCHKIGDVNSENEQKKTTNVRIATRSTGERCKQKSKLFYQTSGCNRDFTLCIASKSYLLTT